MSSSAAVLKRLVRTASLILLAAIGTIVLVRFAPGYFADTRELDGQYADGARATLKAQQEEQGSVLTQTSHLLGGWFHGDLGRSRHYEVPVIDLLGSRAKVTGILLLSGMAYGWLFALCLALPLSARRTGAGETLIAGPSAILLAIPIGAMATTCLIANVGGPVFVLSILIGVREFKMVYRLLRQTWKAPHLLYAKSQGISIGRLIHVYLLPSLRTELLALAVTSFVITLSAIVPVEVIFDVPGLGQLAWSAAMNRDLPVLLAVTLIVAGCVGLASTVVSRSRTMEMTPCA
jgi:peptide/nickel transport system permease protein